MQSRKLQGTYRDERGSSRGGEKEVGREEERMDRRERQMG